VCVCVLAGCEVLCAITISASHSRILLEDIHCMGSIVYSDAMDLIELRSQLEFRI
jgi:hypothetical protein